MSVAARQSPKPGICAEKKRLGETLLEALHEVMALQDREMAAVAASGEGLARYDLALRLARSRRDNARGLYLAHIGVHGC